MPLKCSLCDREDRAEIDRAIASGTSVRRIAGRHGTSKSAVDRHRAHVEEKIAKAAKKIAARVEAKVEAEIEAAVEAVALREASGGPDLVTQLLDLSRETREILSEARGAKDRDGALRAIARLEKQAELQAKILGQIRDGQVNVAIVDPVAMLRAAALAADERRRALPAALALPARDVEQAPVEARAIDTVSENTEARP